MKLLAVDPDGTHCFTQPDCKVTEKELERLLVISHDGIYWFAKALKRQRPPMKWSV